MLCRRLLLVWAAIVVTGALAACRVVDQRVETTHDADGNIVEQQALTVTCGNQLGQPEDDSFTNTDRQGVSLEIPVHASPPEYVWAMEYQGVVPPNQTTYTTSACLRAQFDGLGSAGEQVTINGVLQPQTVTPADGGAAAFIQATPHMHTMARPQTPCEAACYPLSCCGPTTARPNDAPYWPTLDASGTIIINVPMCRNNINNPESEDAKYDGMCFVVPDAIVRCRSNHNTHSPIGTNPMNNQCPAFAFSDTQVRISNQGRTLPTRTNLVVGKQVCKPDASPALSSDPGICMPDRDLTTRDASGTVTTCRKVYVMDLFTDTTQNGGVLTTQKARCGSAIAAVAAAAGILTALSGGLFGAAAMAGVGGGFLAATVGVVAANNGNKFPPAFQLPACQVEQCTVDESQRNVQNRDVQVQSQGGLLTTTTSLTGYSDTLTAITAVYDGADRIASTRAHQWDGQDDWNKNFTSGQLVLTQNVVNLTDVAVDQKAAIAADGAYLVKRSSEANARLQLINDTISSFGVADAAKVDAFYKAIAALTSSMDADERAQNDVASVAVGTEKRNSELSGALSAEVDNVKTRRSFARQHWQDVDNAHAAGLEFVLPSYPPPQMPSPTWHTPAERWLLVDTAMVQSSSVVPVQQLLFAVWCDYEYLIASERGWFDVVDLQQMVGPTGCVVNASLVTGERHANVSVNTHCTCWIAESTRTCTTPPVAGDQPAGGCGQATLVRNYTGVVEWNARLQSQCDVGSGDVIVGSLGQASTWVAAATTGANCSTSPLGMSAESAQFGRNTLPALFYENWRAAMRMHAALGHVEAAERRQLGTVPVGVTYSAASHANPSSRCEEVLALATPPLSSWVPHVDLRPLGLLTTSAVSSTSSSSTSSSFFDALSVDVPAADLLSIRLSLFGEDPWTNNYTYDVPANQLSSSLRAARRCGRVSYVRVLDPSSPGNARDMWDAEHPEESFDVDECIGASLARFRVATTYSEAFGLRCVERVGGGGPLCNVLDHFLFRRPTAADRAQGILRAVPRVWETTFVMRVGMNTIYDHVRRGCPPTAYVVPPTATQPRPTLVVRLAYANESAELRVVVTGGACASDTLVTVRADDAGNGGNATVVLATDTCVGSGDVLVQLLRSDTGDVCGAWNVSALDTRPRANASVGAETATVFRAQADMLWSSLVTGIRIAAATVNVSRTLMNAIVVGLRTGSSSAADWAAFDAVKNITTASLVPTWTWPLPTTAPNATTPLITSANSNASAVTLDDAGREMERVAASLGKLVTAPALLAQLSNASAALDVTSSGITQTVTGMRNQTAAFDQVLVMLHVSMDALDTDNLTRSMFHCHTELTSLEAECTARGVLFGDCVSDLALAHIQAALRRPANCLVTSNPFSLLNGYCHGAGQATLVMGWLAVATVLAVVLLYAVVLLIWLWAYCSSATVVASPALRWSLFMRGKSDLVALDVALHAFSKRHAGELGSVHVL
jgi:hypothetical protein